MSAALLTQAQLSIVRFCAEECERQRSGERSVAWMLEAWQYAMTHATTNLPTKRDVLNLGAYVEPVKNAKGYRRCGVRVGWSVKGPWEQVPRQIDNLLGAVDTLAPAEWYRQYEEVHPFVDGNGRTGSLLYNWLSGTLADPTVPPDFWSEPPPVAEPETPRVSMAALEKSLAEAKARQNVRPRPTRRRTASHDDLAP